MEPRYTEVNRRGWERLAYQGHKYTCPRDPEDFARAREILDPGAWIPWDEIRSVLCLAGGGGSHGPLFASMGCRVTVFDLSEAQLETDRRAAREHGFAIEVVAGDMLDLSRLHDRRFDLVYQPVSALYVPDVRAMYREVRRVVRMGSYYYGTHWNPLYVQLPEAGEWDGQAYRIVHPQVRGSAIPQSSWTIEGRDFSIETLQFIHPLEDLIGGLCDTGFVVTRYAEPEADPAGEAEPGSLEHLARYIPPTLRLFAQCVR